jgi:hypothetical protein
MRKAPKKSWIIEVLEDYNTNIIFKNMKGETVKKIPTTFKAGTYQCKTKKAALAAIQSHIDSGGKAVAHF